MNAAARIILASRSPQRRALLDSLGVDFRVVASRIEEGADPVCNARAKAEEVANRSGVPPGGCVIGCDTEVVLDGRSLGKPDDRSRAAAMLDALAGRRHQVVSAIALIGEHTRREKRAVTDVWMRELSPQQRDWYLNCGEWRERAGGYAIQGAGAALIERIAGEYSTVVGLPLGCLADALDELSLAPWGPSRTGRNVQNNGG